MFRTLKIAILISVVSVLHLPSAFAQTPTAEIQSTISDQIKAFQADDFAGAFQYASPNLRRLFGTPDNFRTMVTRGYPMVWRPSEVRYLELAEIGGDLWQKVLIKDQDGRVHVLAYSMLQTEMGWKINGVQLIPQPGVAA